MTVGNWYTLLRFAYVSDALVDDGASMDYVSGFDG